MKKLSGQKNEPTIAVWMVKCALHGTVYIGYTDRGEAQKMADTLTETLGRHIHIAPLTVHTGETK